MARQLRARRCAAGLALLAAGIGLAALPAAGKARTNAAQTARPGLVTPRDVAGLISAPVPVAARRAWAALLPASARVDAAVGLLRGPKVALVSRATLARTSAQAAAVARTLRRLPAARLARLDAAAAGRGPLGPGRAHAVWSAGSWVGQVSVLGAGRPGAALARAVTATVRARVAAELGKTAWDKVLDQVRPDGSVTVITALRAFSLAIAPVPGVRVPAGPVGTIPDGTLAVSLVLSQFDRLTGAQRSAVTQALARLHGGSQHAFRRPAGLGTCIQTGDWEQSDTYQKLAEQEAATIGTKLGVTLTLTLCVGTGALKDATADAVTLVLNANGGWQSGPPTDCWITVGPKGQQQTGADLKDTLAHEVFHCFQGQIAGIPTVYGLPKWVREGGAAWAACDVVPGSPYASSMRSGYLATPNTPLFARTYSAIGFFSLLTQHGIDLWSRWPAILVAAKGGGSEAAYQEAVDVQADAILWAWAAGYAQNVARGSDWDVAGPCKPSFTYAPRADADIANGSTATLLAPEWAAGLFVPYSSADVVHIAADSGHVRLSSSSLDVELHSHGEADYCTSAQGNCTCPGSSGSELHRIDASGNTLIALTGGPTGAEATVTGMSLDDYCGKTAGPSESCSLVPAKQVRSILGFTNSLVLNNVEYSSDPVVHRGCVVGAWSGPKPTSFEGMLQTAKSGHGGAFGYETWAQGGGPNADSWPKNFTKMVGIWKKAQIEWPGLFTSAGWPSQAFAPMPFGHPAAGNVVQPQGVAKGLVAAVGCWWDDSAYSAICLLDEEAIGKPVAKHLNELAAIAVPKFLG